MLLILSLSSLMAFVATYFSIGQDGDYMQPVRKWLRLDLKPFNCVVCLSAWVGMLLWLALYLYGNAGLQDVYCVYTTIVFSLVLYRLIP